MAPPACRRRRPRARRPTAPPAALSGHHLTAVLLNLRRTSRVRRSDGPYGAAEAIDRDGLIADGLRVRARRRRRSRSRRVAAVRHEADPPVAHDQAAATRRSRTPAGRRSATAGICPRPRTRCDRGREPGRGPNPRRTPPPSRWRAGRRSASRVTHVALPPDEFVGGGWPWAISSAAVVDVTSGSTRTSTRCSPRPARTGGSNSSGSRSGRSTSSSRRPGARHRCDGRKAAYTALQKQLATGRSCSLAFEDEVDGGPRPLQGPSPASSRAVGPVLGCANMAPRRGPVSRSRGPRRGGGIGRRARFRT